MNEQTSFIDFDTEAMLDAQHILEGQDESFEENGTEGRSKDIFNAWVSEIRSYKIISKEETLVLGQRLYELRKMHNQTWCAICELNYKLKYSQNGLQSRLEQLQTIKGTDKMNICAESLLRAVEKPDKSNLVVHLRQLRRIKEEMQMIADMLIKTNLRYVVKIASRAKMFSRHFSFVRVANISLLDLIQEGNKGLMRAVDTWDYTKASFISYAHWWIKQGIYRYIYNHGRIIRYPVHVNDQITQMLRAMHAIRKKTSLDSDWIDTAEISEHMSATPEKIKTITEVSNIHILSLSQQIKSSENKDLESFIADQSIADPEIQSWVSMSNEIARGLLKCLPPRNIKVIKMRFGIQCDQDNPLGREYTLEEIGRKFNLTRERIRQIEFKSLKKMRQHSKRKKIINLFT